MANESRNGSSSVPVLDIKDVSSSEYAVAHPKKPKYDLQVVPPQTEDALTNRFGDFVEAEASDHLMTWLGYIDPALVIQLSRNLGRKLRLEEVKLLGGPDGDTRKLCELSVEALCNERNVDEVAKLSETDIAKCLFVPGWGLSLEGGAIVHLLNVMLDPNRTEQNDLRRALPFVRQDQILVYGNKVVVRQDGTGTTTEAFVSGKPWHVSNVGVIYPGHGHIGNLEKELKKADATFEICAENVSAASILQHLRQEQEKEKHDEVIQRVKLTRGFAARLLGRA